MPANPPHRRRCRPADPRPSTFDPTDARRLLLLRLIARRGPLTVAAMRDEIKLPLAAVRALLSHQWFAADGEAIQLSALGRSALEQSGRRPGE